MRWLVLGLLVCVSAACQGKEQCLDWAGSSGSTSWGNCGDKKSRKIECDMAPWNVMAGTPKPKTVECTCTIDGIVGNKFQTMDPTKLGTMESATSIANEQCGWHVKR
jgi:hypothetical protein